MSDPLFESAPMAQWVVEDGAVVRANAKARALFGWSSLGAPPEAPDQAEAKWLADPDGTPRSVQLRANDRSVRLFLAATPTPSGLHFAGLADQHRALDRSFFANKDALAQLLEALPIGVYVITAEGAGYYANERAFELLGRGLVQTTDELTVYQTVVRGSQDPYPVARMPIVRALQGESARADDLALIRPDGIMPIDVWAAPVHGPNGNVRYAVAVFADASERRAAEAERDALQAQLLEASRAAGMAQIATSVLHDVGNVLNSVKVSTTQLDRMLEKSSARHLEKTVALLEAQADLASFFAEDPRGQRLPAFLRKLADAVGSESTAMQREVDQLAARIKHMQTVVAAQQSAATRQDLRQRLDLVELLQGSVAVIQHQIDRIEASVTWAAPGPVVVETDRHKVMQAVLNLLSNACDAVADRDERRITLTCHLEDRHAVIRVSDSGPGVAPEQRGRVFRSGFSTKPEGHGFGLHSAANVVAELGGTLQLLDGTGGATFEIRLPAS